LILSEDRIDWNLNGSIPCVAPELCSFDTFLGYAPLKGTIVFKYNSQ
jgi:hypothetical protein